MSPCSPVLSHITSKPCLSNTAATNSCPSIFTHPVSTISNISLEMVDTLCLHREDLSIPMMAVPTTRISSCSGPTAAKIYSVGTEPGCPNGGDSMSPCSPVLSHITSKPCLSNTAATNSCPSIFTHPVSTISNISLEMVDTLCLHREDLSIPMMAVPTTRISSCSGPTAAKIYSVGTGGISPCCAALPCQGRQILTCLIMLHSTSLVGTHMWVKSCCPVVQPNSSFWQQLIHCEDKLLSSNKPQMISSLSRMVPSVYESEVGVMLLW
ncbi:PREDICTED: LOW QUALITY PROTEIN: dual specificity protein phosphatase 18-like, partial [Chaetura pelagica]|uniref:LOW QUALITY PROTEIN: dual specificity protein phosphatase 18-like n=1 Tax=Chaetura pelagica TaxID=8897 RepID=UPI00052369A8